ncbi:MAG: hypothetical protein IT317_21285 [Anaerolineales bacterium]|nr:hypothetical protein [Anaerolineales bacterium]
MKPKSVHEPEAEVMSAVEVQEDARRVASALRQNLIKAEPAVQLEVPLSTFLSALDKLSRDELLILRHRVDERLAA